MDRVGGPCAALEHLGERRLGVGVGVEVVGEVALGIGVDRQHVEAQAAEDVARVRVIVVLPVPPFWESIAIVTATAVTI